ncbi:iron-sulfur protein [Rhizocola hellebori]|uniref:Cytochrome bc1 complex Rieske iron-sulfur subunit n=1 Tax=Rhizocola hellebori TaxID=1392758 RepID=A0A8J3QFG7_9ACTN|nr:Rieske (2Fe-2S) protein [Rhizocola hellebori]GIH08630.1 iron-sulfur protein [Rhizocola hellebori]
MTSRRVILTGGCAAAALLAGCQAYGDEQVAEPAQQQPPAQANAPGSSGPAAAPPAGAPALAKVADIPVGGGKVFADRKVVLTQPSAGVIKAFSAVCTHQGCTVEGVSGGTINCPCHGSAFKVADGSVAAGPAKRALPAVAVTVVDGAIKLA